MIDSVYLRRSSLLPLPARALSKFTRKGDRAFYRAQEINYSPTIFYFRAPDSKYYLSVQASLPKLIYGDNVQMLGEAELNDALKILQEFASKHLGVFFDVFTATVGRVDYCYNFPVGEDLIYQYLLATAEAEPARMKRRLIGKIETVEFANKSRKIYCYDKKREAEYLFRRNKISAEAVAAARGVLRLEVRYNTTEAVKRLSSGQLKLPDIQAQTLLNFDIAESVLTSAVESLKLHEPIIPFDKRLDKLQKKYGYGSRFHRLAGFLYLCDTFGFDKL